MRSVRHLSSFFTAGVFLLVLPACSGPVSTDSPVRSSTSNEKAAERGEQVDSDPDQQAESVEPARPARPLDPTWSATESVEALRSIGGTVELDEKHQAQVISLAFLQSRLSDDQLAPIAGFTELKRLSLERTVVSDAGMKHLRLLKNLESLNLNLTRITGKGLRVLKGFNKLKLLELSGPRITDSSLKQLPRLPGLEELRLRNTSVTDRGLKWVARFSGLKKLDLQGTQVTGSGLGQLSHLDLETLNLGHSQITMAGLESIKKLTSLKKLDLTFDRLKDKSLSYLQGLTNLEQLTLNRNPGIKGPGLRHLKKMKQLRLLELLSARAGDRQLHILASLPNLETLDLQYTQTSNAGLLQLKDFPKLAVVRVFRSKVTKNGVERLNKVAPQIEVIRQPFWLEQLDGGPPKQVHHDAQKGVLPVREDVESDFPGYLGPQRNGIVQGPALSTDWDAQPPKELWRMPIGGGYSSFAVVGDHAVTAEQRDQQEAIVCYDARTGQQLWIYRYNAFFSDEWGGEGPRATPTVVDGEVYNLGALGQLVCLDLATGTEKWSTNILTTKDGKEITNVLWGMSGSPLVVGDRVIVNPGSDHGDGLAAYSRKTGELLWRAPTLSGFNKNMAGYSSPMSATFDGMEQIVIFSGAGLTGHDPATGARLWDFKWPQLMGTNIAQPLLLAGDRILISTGYKIGSALIQIRRDEAGWSAEQIWKSKGLRCKHSSPVLHGDYIYGLDEGILACISVEDGSQQWKSGRFGHGQILLSGDVIVVLSEKGKLAVVNATPDGFELLDEIQALPETKTWNPPALFGGRLLLRNDIEVVCYDLQVD